MEYFYPGYLNYFILTCLVSLSASLLLPNAISSMLVILYLWVVHYATHLRPRKIFSMNPMHIYPSYVS